LVYFTEKLSINFFLGHDELRISVVHLLRIKLTFGSPHFGFCFPTQNRDTKAETPKRTGIAAQEVHTC
jgi:hypothetical protein